MSRVAYVNGRYLPHAMAAVHVEDRGYQFADGVYEVIAIQNEHLVDEDEHLSRLGRSLSEVRIAWPISPRSMRVIMREVIRRNRITGRGIVYVQVTRGVAPRIHGFPASAKSALVITARSLPQLDGTQMRQGVYVITTPDLRWTRRDIKSISLLPNVLAKQQAIDLGAFEAWMVDGGGTITEGTASNAWIVTAEGDLVTRHADGTILNGITRRMIVEICSEHAIPLVERGFTVDEAKVAREAFLTSTTLLVKPVIRIDDINVGDGAIGPITESLLEFYLGHMSKQPESGRP